MPAVLPVNRGGAHPDGVVAAAQDPWEHPSMVAQREKAVSYAAKRAATKEGQNTRLLHVGIIIM